MFKYCTNIFQLYHKHCDKLDKPQPGLLDMGSIFQAEEPLLRVATSIGQQQSTTGYQVISEKRRLLGRSKPNSGSGSDKIFS